MATIRDIAKLSGVSKSTVARALNNDGYVKEATRVKIERAVKELDYTPNYMARGMRTNKSSTIGLFIPDYANPFYPELFRGIESVTREAGYVNLVCHTDEQADRELFYIEELIKRQIDGIIFCTYNRNDKSREFLEEIEKKTPIVFMDPVFRDLGFSTVVSDGYFGTKMAVEHLYGLGCRNIAYIKGPKIHAVTHERYQGYRDGLKEYDLKFRETSVYETSDFRMESGGKAAAFFIEGGTIPDAIIAATDVLAIGALKELRKRRVSVPEQIKVIGFDNISLAELVEPSLTTVAQPIHQLGVRAAQLLIEQIGNRNVPRQQVVLSCDIVKREST
ncbi:MAG: LacI family transcriptional regulator [Spirochaetia bacterium]|nr:LacI family transcriptional regulator [Spirochaetia bacterium]